MTINVAILGCSGRMGRNLIDAANQHKSISLAAGSVRKGSSFDGIDLGELAGIGSIGKNASSDLNSLVDADVLIDFTSIPSTFEHLKWCKEHNKAIVIGTTGFTEEERAIIDEAAKVVPIDFCGLVQVPRRIAGTPHTIYTRA